MRDSESRLLAEKYQLILEGKALTPEQIAKKAKPAGSNKGGGKGGLCVGNGCLETSNKEGKKTEQPSDNDAEKRNQDGENIEVKDPYVLKETEEGETQIEGGSEEPATDIQGEAAVGAPPHPTEQPAGTQPPTKQSLAEVPFHEDLPNPEDLVYQTAMELTGTLEHIAETLKKFDPQTSRIVRVDLVMALKRIVDDFKYNRLPNQVTP